MNALHPTLSNVGKQPVSVFLIWLVTLSGMIGIALGHGDWFLPKTPFNLLLAAVLLLWNFPWDRKIQPLLVWLAVFIIGMTVEILGVNYGLFFGDYHYGKNMGPLFLGVPWTIGINWTVLTFLSAYISQQWVNNRWMACLSGAVLMVGLDFFIEPIAPLFDYWHWDLGHAPLQNFIAWFVVAFFLQNLVYKLIPKRSTVFPYHHFSSQILFFAFFYVYYQL